MNSRRFFKSAATAILLVGVFTTGLSAPAQADGGVITTKTGGSTTNDTGWGYK